LVALSTWETAIGATVITHLDQDPARWIIKTDPVLMTVENLEWKPSVDRTKPNFEEASPSLCAYSMTVCRPLCWRLDEGVRASINWAIVKDMLQQQFDVNVGAVKTVTVFGDVSVPECYRVGGIDVAVSFTRDYYRVVQNGNSAVISILTPVDGMQLVYHDLELLPFRACTSVAQPMSAPGLCASMTGLPESGNACPGDGRTKRDFEDPVLSEPFESVTWSQIKALYGVEQ
jgi:hypothetical protein